MKLLAGRITLAGSILAGATSLTFADDLSGYVELSAASLSETNEIQGLPPFRSDTTSYRSRVNFLWTRRILPNFQAQVGAFYERFDDSIDQLGFDQESERTTRPFARLTVRSPWLLGEIGWDRNEETARTDDLARFRLTRDTFLATAGWYPVDLPSARLELSRVEDRDSERQFEDRTESAVRLTSDYTPVESTRLYYRGALEEVEDRIEGTDLRTTSPTGR